jgi:hypothetical protein
MTEVAAPVAGQEAPTTGVQQIAEGVKPEAQGGAPAAVEAKPAEAAASAKPAEGETKTGEAAEIVYDIKLPQGMPVDEVSQSALVEIAKANKWSPEVAQQVVDLAVQRETQRVAAANKQADDWEAAVKADPALGGDKLAETLATARRAMDLGPPELKAFLHETRIGSHPAVVKWMHTIGKALSEDKLVPGGAGPSGGKTAAQVLYPNQS